MALNTTDLKKGAIFQLGGVPYRVMEYSQKVMGRGGSIVNVRIKSLLDGKVQDRTLRGGDQIDTADVTSQPVQYLYKDGQHHHFMNTNTYEQYSVPATTMEGKDEFIREGDNVSAQFFKGQIINIELPKNVDLKVTDAEKAVRGDTSSSITKNATLETGLRVKVPAFIKTGDIISVDTTTGAYRARQKG
jgi:elongation factor P